MKICPNCGYRELSENQEACIQALERAGMWLVASFCRQQWTRGQSSYIDARQNCSEHLRGWVWECNKEATSAQA